MRTEDRTKIQNSIARGVLSLLSLVLQIWWISLLFIRLSNYSAIISTLTSIVALGIAIWIYNYEGSPVEFKAPLIMLILAFPIVGLCMFLMIERKGTSKRMRTRFLGIHQEKKNYILQDETVLRWLEGKDSGIANQFRYLAKTEGFPVFDDSDIEFFPQAKDAYRALLEAVRQAEEFVFLEYHAIEDSVAFRELKAILLEKVKKGVEVRILYDDVGSIGFLNGSFMKKMNALGIKCRVFNRISPAFRLFMNNRDHRKITVVDGKRAFTGGYNLADEYFDITRPYGKWKDTGVAITGNAVNSMTEMFLAMWNSSDEVPEDFSRYYRLNERCTAGGYIQPYADNPLDDSYVGENVYMNMIKNAKRTLYLTTPYLILGHAMQRELTMASERGVDVRIVTPGIPDKKLIYRVTRSYYEGLVKRGVKIYEYTPGFLHAKQMVADDDIAVVGTINMDYRSFYHHFENAVMLYEASAVNKISEDFEDLFYISKDVSDEYRYGRKNRWRLLDGILRLAAPLF